MAKNYSVSITDPDKFVKDVDNLSGLAGIWLMSWGPHVFNQVSGVEPPPTRFVTRENDPYKRR